MAREPATRKTTSSETTARTAAASETNGNGKPAFDEMTHTELQDHSRAAEARAAVFRGRAAQDPRFNGKLQEARESAVDINTRLRDMDDPVNVVPDKEGTAPTLADATGTFAADAEVANVGGIGIKDSNADPEKAKEIMTGERAPDTPEEEVGISDAERRRRRNAAKRAERRAARGRRTAESEAASEA